jgi:ParB-like chromosome segregation protein Spo0J
LKNRNLRKAGTAMAKLARINLTPLRDGASLEQLRAIEASEARSTARPASLPLADIHVSTDAFQWRDMRGNEKARDDHVLTLSRALQDQERPLDPLLVVPVGSRFFVVDGHHRLAAYRSVGWSNGVPVEVFEGSLEKARQEALARNSKDKLSMSRREKSEAAWKLVQEGGGLTKEQQARLSGVSPRTIASMRRALREHGEKVRGLSWTEARRFVEGWKKDPQEDNWREAQVQELLALLEKTSVAGKLRSAPDIAALALQRLDDRLARTIVLELAGDYLDDLDVEQIREDLEFERL